LGIRNHVSRPPSDLPPSCPQITRAASSSDPRPSLDPAPRPRRSNSSVALVLTKVLTPAQAVAPRFLFGPGTADQEKPKVPGSGPPCTGPVVDVDSSCPRETPPASAATNQRRNGPQGSPRLSAVVPPLPAPRPGRRVSIEPQQRGDRVRRPRVRAGTPPRVDAPVPVSWSPKTALPPTAAPGSHVKTLFPPMRPASYRVPRLGPEPSPRATASGGEEEKGEGRGGGGGSLPTSSRCPSLRILETPR